MWWNVMQYAFNANVMVWLCHIHKLATMNIFVFCLGHFPLINLILMKLVWISMHPLVPLYVCLTANIKLITLFHAYMPTYNTPAQRSWRGDILDSPCPSVSPSVRSSVCRWHGFRSISQVCFGISISNFICMLMVAIGRSLLIFSVITFKMAAWRPYWIFLVSGL